MSLMLRKSCQEILDKYHIDDLHVSIDSRERLAIVSECGKPFMTIQGIHFNRQQPTSAEIEYATELLDNFLLTHIADISLYRKRKATYEKKGILKDPSSPFRITGRSCNDLREGTTFYKLELEIKTKYFTGQLDNDLKFSFIFNSKSINYSGITQVIANLKKVDFDKKLIVEGKKILNIWIADEKERVFIDKLRVKLSSCNI